MRILLWLLVLLCVFGAVSLYHSRFTSRAREERVAAHAAAESGRPLPEGFGARVIVGEKSGAPIVDGLRPAEPPKPNPAESKASPTSATTHVVKRGEALSTIADKYYGTSKRDLVDALARFNKLKNASAIREGQTLTIPPLASLGLAAK